MNSAEIIQVDAHTVKVSGVIHVSNAMKLKAQGEAFIKAAQNSMVADLAGIEHSGSVGISILLAWMREAQAQDKEIVFKNIPGKMFDIARVSGLDEVLPLAVNEADG